MNTQNTHAREPVVATRPNSCPKTNVDVQIAPELLSIFHANCSDVIKLQLNVLGTREVGVGVGVGDALLLQLVLQSLCCCFALAAVAFAVDVERGAK